MTPEQTTQARKNLDGLFRYYDLPTLRVAARFDDRCFWYLTDEWLLRIEELVRNDKFRPWKGYSNHGVKASGSFRENVARNSMQIILHGVEGPDLDRLVEADIDRWNPDFGVWPAMMHLAVDVLGPAADPFEITKALRARDVKVG